MDSRKRIKDTLEKHKKNNTCPCGNSENIIYRFRENKLICPKCNRIGMIKTEVKKIDGLINVGSSVEWNNDEIKNKKI